MSGTNRPPIALDADLEPWEHQLGETPKRYSQFCDYRDLGRARTLRKVADTLALNDRYVRAVSAEFRWVERAEAFDLNRDRLHEAAWLEERRKAAENDAKLLGAFVGKLADRLRTLKTEDLSTGDAIRLLDVTMRHRRALFGDPTATIAVTGPGGDPLTVQLAELSGMTSEQRQSAIAALVETVQRRSSASDAVDDDD